MIASVSKCYSSSAPLLRSSAARLLAPSLSIQATQASSSFSSTRQRLAAPAAASFRGNERIAVAATAALASAAAATYAYTSSDVGRTTGVAKCDAAAPAPQPVSVPVDTAVVEEMTADERSLEAKAQKAKKYGGGLKLFSGNGNMALAMEIAKNLGTNLGKATVSRFADGEVNVMIHENVRGKDVYVIQPTCPPVNENLMELLLMVSTLNRASARRITVVIPYYGYARQDRKMQARVPISAADVARLLEAMGIDRVIAVDLHCGQIQGFFGPRVPVDNLDGGIVGINYFGDKDLYNPVIVSPDAGGVYRAKKFKEGLSHKFDMDDVGLAMIIKQRARAGTVDKMDLVGDVKGCDCIIVDDMIDTAGTLCKAADVLAEKGAKRVFAFASHGLLSGPGNDRIANSSMEECVILNTIPSTPQRATNEKLTELSIAPLLAQTIFNVHARKSISALFK
mmetsp:Transcript_8395/g.18405  ORF Transcript_8395/g.18405 Transcript_8395/m.18405 type:complete len:453 (-) Transcript_8395:101-1459(-)